MKTLLFVLLSFSLCFSSEKKPNLPDDEMTYLQALYHDLHAKPELSFHEVETAKRMAFELEKIGLKVTTGIGGHGLVAVLENGEGPTLLLRADMDALPVAEKTGLAYASKVKILNKDGTHTSVMHACGHDMHMSVLVGTARKLMASKEKWQGRLLFVFQPAEERGAGARAMLKDGLFERFGKPDFNFAFHVASELPAGTIGYRSEYTLANVDTVDITVRGIGGHGAYPHTTKDPIVLAARLVLGFQTIISREVSPLESAVITVGSIHGGTKHNIIGAEVKLQLTVRSYSDETRNLLLKRIKEISEGEARTAGLPENLLPLVTIKENYTPAVYNDPKLTEKIVQNLKNILGEKALVEVPPVMGGEDFALYSRVKPRIASTLLWLGAVDPKVYAKAKKEGKNLPTLHSSKFAPLPKETLSTGVTAMTAVVENLLSL